MPAPEALVTGTDKTGSKRQTQLQIARGARRAGNRIRRLHHHAVRTDDMEATRHFYEDVVGTPLVSALKEKCHTKPITILYFYSNDCPDCTNQGYVLTTLRSEYPQLRVYSFDSDLDLSAIKTLQTVNHVPDEKPSLVINGTTYAGFKSIDDIKKILAPELKKLDDAKKAADKAASKKSQAASSATTTAQ